MAHAMRQTGGLLEGSPLPSVELLWLRMIS